jgi:hypothetical protein
MGSALEERGTSQLTYSDYYPAFGYAVFNVSPYTPSHSNREGIGSLSSSSVRPITSTISGGLLSCPHHHGSELSSSALTPRWVVLCICDGWAIISSTPLNPSGKEGTTVYQNLASHLYSLLYLSICLSLLR